MSWPVLAHHRSTHDPHGWSALPADVRETVSAIAFEFDEAVMCSEWDIRAGYALEGAARETWRVGRVERLRVWLVERHDPRVTWED